MDIKFFLLRQVLTALQKYFIFIFITNFIGIFIEAHIYGYFLLYCHRCLFLFLPLASFSYPLLKKIC
jgi:hypothetical protein